MQCNAMQHTNTMFEVRVLIVQTCGCEMCAFGGLQKRRGRPPKAAANKRKEGAIKDGGQQLPTLPTPAGDHHTFNEGVTSTGSWRHQRSTDNGSIGVDDAESSDESSLVFPVAQQDSASDRRIVGLGSTNEVLLLHSILSNWP